MQFSNGCWINQKGVEVFSPAQVYFTKIEKGKLTLCAPSGRIESRGATLGGVNVTIEITSPVEGILRVKAYHYAGTVKKEPNYELNLSGDYLEIAETDETVSAKSGNLSVVFNKHNGEFAYFRGDVPVTKSGRKDLAYVRTNWQGLPYDDGGEGNAYFRQQLSLSVSERVYGLGERFSAFVKNGQTVDIWNEDGGTSTNISYKNIPFFMTNKGYGVFVNNSGKVSFEVASENVAKIGFSVVGEELDYFLIDGPDMKAVLNKYTELTGRAPLLPQWTFGLWLSTSFTTNYDESTVMSFIDGMFERGIPLKVFHFDCFWMREFCWTDFTWDSRVFPDPVGMLSRIKAKGLKVCVWINPYIGQESILFNEGVENGYFIKRGNGDVWQIDMWQPGMAIVDFTNPDACKWYQSKLRGLLDMGVDCFKTDFGERIPSENVRYFNGADPVRMHNYFTYMYNKTVFELVREVKGEKEAIVFARSATTGGQKFPVHWGGDCFGDYESMEQSLRGGLSLTMSGFSFWSHDIGGFESTASPDVYKRWAAFGLLSSHSRLHGSNSYRVPWVYDDEAVDVVRFFTKLKARLMPYIYSAAVFAHETGVPVMRSMPLEFIADKNCDYLDKQYMLGESLLVAPIFNAESVAEYYLPEGLWTDFLSGKEYLGGSWVTEHRGYLDAPILVRPNSIIPVGSRDDTPEYDYAEGVEFRVYAIISEAKCAVKDSDGDVIAEIKITNDAGVMRVTHRCAGKFTVRFVNRNILSVENGTIAIDGNDSVWTPNLPN
ncbi:alpha-xylosidase [Clostridia bacterium]|nr:alpha-xylosidase [Clostridia bacterium]